MIRYAQPLAPDRLAAQDGELSRFVGWLTPHPAVARPPALPGNGYAYQGRGAVRRTFLTLDANLESQVTSRPDSALQQARPVALLVESKVTVGGPGH